ncbi:MAG: dephospho-CoA kinase [Phycisphaeraceae bacterium]|nr:dephospho-CoA kinase [Phycisphaeraceae bacterium]
MTTFQSNPGERTILQIRPSLASIVLQPIRSIVVLVLGFALLWWFVPPTQNRSIGLSILLGLLILRVVWQAIWVACARYELTNERARSTVGVFSRFGVEIALSRVQNTFLSRSLLERLAGVGTIGIASAGTGGVEVIWSMVDSPHDVLASVRRALGASPGEAGLDDDSTEDAEVPKTKESGTTESHESRPIVLGLVGGIGAGKSAVAKEFESRGALILDSDSRAKAVLETPEARNTLASWWGPEILRDGKVDRKRVADIVFSDPAQRRKLESFVHPKLREGRRREIEAAAARGVRFIVIDAPLLLEAGVDEECDAVVFVDAPREQRLERVRDRGWDDAELSRRESAQMPLESKRSRSDYVVTNDGNLANLGENVANLIRNIQSARPLITPRS